MSKDILGTHTLNLPTYQDKLQSVRLCEAVKLASNAEAGATDWWLDEEGDIQMYNWDNIVFL